MAWIAIGLMVKILKFKSTSFATKPKTTRVIFKAELAAVSLGHEILFGRLQKIFYRTRCSFRSGGVAFLPSVKAQENTADLSAQSGGCILGSRQPTTR